MSQKTRQEESALFKKNKFLKITQLRALKDKLLSEKERILNKELNEQEMRTLDKNELSDPIDEANINIQASQDIRFRNRENIYLKKIEKTLARIYDSNYGECNECGCEVGFERLIARPTADVCITCKEESELAERSNFFLKKSKSLGKTLQEITGRR